MTDIVQDGLGSANGGARGRNGEVDLMRVVLAVVIMVFHARFFWRNTETPPFAAGVYAVDFFFLLSGILMGKSITSGRIGDTFAFLKRKLSSFYLVFVASTLIACVEYYMSCHLSQSEAAEKLLLGIFELLLVGQGGLQPFTGFNAVSWYLPAMMLGMAILHPIAMRHRKWFFPIGSILVAACCYGVLFQNCGGITGGRSWTGFSTYRMIRAIASISLGVFIFDMSERTHRSVAATKAGCFFFTLIKVLSIAAFLTIMFNRPGHKAGFFCMLFLALYLYLAFSGLSDIGWLRRIHLGWCSPASLYIFLNHFGVLHILNRDLIRESRLPVWVFFVFLIVGTIAACLLCAALVAIFRRSVRVISPLLLTQLQPSDASDGTNGSVNLKLASGANNSGPDSQTGAYENKQKRKNKK